MHLMGFFKFSGGRINGFGPKPKEFFKWSKKGTSTDWGIFPNQDSLMYDFKYANWAKNELEKNHNSPFFGLRIYSTSCSMVYTKKVV